jgi:hypothetical protein
LDVVNCLIGAPELFSMKKDIFFRMAIQDEAVSLGRAVIFAVLSRSYPATAGT